MFNFLRPSSESPDLSKLRAEIDKLKERLSLREKDILDMSSIISQQSGFIDNLSNLLSQQSTTLGNQNITLKSVIQQLSNNQSSINETRNWALDISSTLKDREEELRLLRERDFTQTEQVLGRLDLGILQLNTSMTQANTLKQEMENTKTAMLQNFESAFSDLRSTREQITTMGSQIMNSNEQTQTDVTSKILYFNQRYNDARQIVDGVIIYKQEIQGLIDSFIQRIGDYEVQINNAKVTAIGQIDSEGSNWLTDFNAKMLEVIGYKTDAMTSYSGTSALYNRITDWFQGQQWDWQALFTRMDGVAGRLATMSHEASMKVEDLRTSISGFEGTLSDLESLANQVTNSLSLNKDELSKFTDLKIFDIDKAVNYFKSDMDDYLQNTFAPNLQLIQDVYSGARNNIQSLSEQMSNYQTILSDNSVVFHNLLDNMQNFRTGFVGQIWTEFENELSEKFQWFRERVVMAVKDPFDEWFAPLKDTVSSVQNSLLGVFAWLQEACRMGKQSYEGLSGRASLVKSFLQTLRGARNTLLEWKNDVLPNNFQEAFNRIQYIWNFSIKMALGLYDSIKMSFAHAKTLRGWYDLAQSGKGMIKGLWKPITYTSKYIPPEPIAYLRNLFNNFESQIPNIDTVKLFDDIDLDSEDW